MARILTPKQKAYRDEVLLKCWKDKAYFAKVFFGMDMVPKQVEALNMTGKIKVKVAGRRFGKSTTTVIDLTHHLLFNKGHVGWVTAPSLDQVKIYWDELEKARSKSAFLEDVIKDIKYAPFPLLVLKNGSVLNGRSASNGGRYVRGKGGHILAVCEASFIPDDTFNKVIRPIVAHTNGEIILESTPYTANYFHNLYNKGLTDGNRIQSFHATSYDNISIPASVWDEIRTEIPDIDFRQEILAEFVDDANIVFKWDVLAPIFDDGYEEFRKGPIPGHRYVIGMDIAQAVDWTVISVMDLNTGKIVEQRRIQNMTYSAQQAIANELSRTYYDALIYYDHTSIGRAMEDLIHAVPFDFTGKSRPELMSVLIVAMEQQKIHIHPDLRETFEEFRVFRRGPSGKMEAPAGKHDDCVMSIALCCWGAFGKPRVDLSAATSIKSKTAFAGLRRRQF